MATYKELDKAFEKKYSKEIAGISKYNDVDLGVAKEMFKTNLDQERGIYGGGGVAENWGEMLTDYKKIKETALTSTKERNTSTSSSSSSSSKTNNNIVAGGSAGGSLLNDFVSQDTIGVVVGVGVLYMFLTMFRR